jgi:hypothetical protein
MFATASDAARLLVCKIFVNSAGGAFRGKR